MSDSWKVIVNLKAGSGKCDRDWPAIKDLLEKLGVVFSFDITEYKYHAIELVRKAIHEGYRNFIAVGGDGTLHEVLDGIMSQSAISSIEMTVAVIPVGSGNDWIRSHNIPESYRDAVEAIAKGSTTQQDIAEVSTFKDGKPHMTYMVNIGGMAFDANVCFHFERMKSKGRSGKMLYVEGVLKAFFGYSSHKFKVVIDKQLFYDGEVFSVAFGIGKYSGGGMLQTPQAEYDDGLIDITVVKKVSKIKILFNLKKLFKGNIFKIREVIHTTAKSIKAESSPISRVEVDGEDVGVSPVELKVIPLAINIIRLEDRIKL